MYLAEADAQLMFSLKHVSFVGNISVAINIYLGFTGF
jgi:hypothetical protein